MKGDVKRKSSPADWLREVLLASSPCVRRNRLDVEIPIVGYLPEPPVRRPDFLRRTQAARVRKGEPWFYRRLEAYSFLGFSEGA
jgi:hypothetical protein